ncbi:MAG: hypothetical protein IPM92_02950 [Saprospiraceae bacterium]|nr:hypothetical protein [Saprospiraceae bacterium]
MKKLLFLVFGIITIMPSCDKNTNHLNDLTDGKQIDLEMRSNDTIYETFYYDGVYYTLEFDSETEAEEGVPFNSETEDALKDAIGENDIMKVLTDEHPDTIFLYNIPETESEPDSSTAMAPSNDPPFATFYEHIDYGGNSFEFTDYSYNKHWRGDCEFEFNIPNLENCALGMSSNWNDRISSFKMHQSGSTKDWMETNMFCGPLTQVAFIMFRNSGYRQTPSGCWIEMWVMHPRCNYDDSDWAVPNLKKQKWGWLFCANMNDKISSISIDFCRYCFADCATYIDWW